MEIERKYLINSLPERLEQYESKQIEQGYLCTNPVVRIRRSNENYILTYKGEGLMVREEYNLPLTKEGYEHMRGKVDGILIKKTRYLIPLTDRLTIELDVFSNELEGLLLAEVEFETEEEANSFIPPAWFGEDVTFSDKYHNSTLSKSGLS
jgi:CYTH domain-containing protein